MKIPIITIAGVPGSGKSTTAKQVAKELGYAHFSSGDLFREVAAEYGVDIGEFNKIAEKQTEVDHRVDGKLRELGEQSEPLVIDSRTAFHWIPASFKVYLKLDSKTAAERVYTQILVTGRASQQAANVEEVMLDIETRKKSELHRYANLYNLDYTREEHYDLIIDTAKHNLDEVVDLILEEYTKHLENIIH